MKTSNLSGVDTIRRQIHMLREFVLSDTNILASTLDAKELADGWPKFVFPRDEVILYAVILKLIINKKKLWIVKIKNSRLKLMKIYLTIL